MTQCQGLNFDVLAWQGEDPGFGRVHSESAEFGPLLVQLSGCFCDRNHVGPTCRNGEDIAYVHLSSMIFHDIPLFFPQKEMAIPLFAAVQ